MNGFIFHPVEGAKYRRNYEKIARDLNVFRDKNDWKKAIELIRKLCWDDLFFLMYFVLGWGDMNHPWLVDRANEVNDNRHKTLDVWSRYHYKDLSCDTPILTTDGWKLHGEIEVGDNVFSPSGFPVKVLAVRHFNDSECYRITFDNGVFIDCGAGHLWKISVPAKNRIMGTSRRVGRRDAIVETRLLSKMSFLFRPIVKATSPIVYDEKLLPLDPYVLGVWIGDGYSSTGCICGMDDGIFDEISRRGYGVVFRKHEDGRHADYRAARIEGLTKALRILDEIGNKHIPETYLTASIEQRRALLQGLIDTDGNISRMNSCVTFTQKNKRIAEQVRFLANSLGFKARLTPIRSCGAWNVTFQARRSDMPCLLKRKLDLLDWKPRRPGSMGWRVHRVERIHTVPTNCIQVDSPDGMYLAGKCLIPTHNSSIITVAGTIQDALRDPMIRGCIFSHTKSIAKDFLRRIKTILETNGLLAAAFEDVIPANPMNTKGWLWSLDDGLQLKCGNEIGGTLQASGLIDSMPTGKHFTRRIYDDVVTREAVSTSEQRNKVSECVRLSHALGDPKNGTHCFIGTRYHFGDFYGELIRGGGYTVREYACTHNGAFPAKPVGVEDDVSPLGDGRAVLYTQDHIWEEFKNMGTATFASQMLMDPIKADEKAFDVNWIRYYNNSTARPHTRNFIFADPAGSKKEGSAYTVMWVVGVDQRNYYYILDCVRDRLDLQQKQRKLFDLVAKWKVIKVYYEKYSMQGDIEYIEEKKREEGFHFPIEEVGGTRLSKDERILKLQPLFQEGRMIFPEKLPYTDCNGKLRNLVDDFIMEEYNEFPVSQYKDMLDALSRLRDEKVKVAGPAYVEPATHETDNPILRWHRQSKDASNGNSWLNA